MKPPSIFTIAALTTLISTASWAQDVDDATAATQAKKVLDRIVAIINDDVLTEFQLEEEIKRIQEQSPEFRVDFNEPRVRAQVLEKMIDDNLIMQMADRVGIVIDELTLDSYMRNLASSQDKTLTQFSQEIEAGGISFNNFRELARAELMRQQMIYGYVAGRVVVLDEDIDNYMKKIPQLMNDEFLVSRILIRSREFDSKLRRKEEDEMLQRYNLSREAGKSFEELVSQYSNDSNQFSGGRLGWLSSRNTPEEYWDALLDMEEGEISEPLLLTSGIHILKLEAVRRQDHTVQEEILAQRILIEAGGELTPERAKIKAVFIYEKLTEGEDFKILAQQYSDDVLTSPSGGDMGWVRKDDVVSAMWQALGSLQVGEYTVPIQTLDGWEILRVKNRRQSDKTTELRRERAQKDIISSRLETEVISWIREVRSGAYIEIIEP